MAEERVISGKIEFTGNAAGQVAEFNDVMDTSVAAVDDLETGTKGAGKAADKAADSTQAWGSALTAVGAGIIASQIFEFGKATLGAAVELERQQIRVRQLAGDDFPGLSDAIDATIKSSKGLRAEGGLSEAAAQALDIGLSADVVAESIEGLSQISTVAGKDLSQVFEFVGQAIEAGTGGPLRKLGILNDEIFQEFGLAANTTLTQLDKETRTRLVLAAIAKKQATSQGAFNELIGSGAGAMDIFNEQMGNIFEIIGGFILPVFKALMVRINPFLIWLSSTEEGLDTMKIGLLILAPIIGGILISALVAATVAAWSFLAPILTAALPIIGIAAAILILILIIDDLITFFQGGESVIGDFIDQFPLLSIPIQFIINQIRLFIGIFEIAWEIISGIFNSLVALFSGNASEAGDIFGEMFDNIMVILKDVFKPILKLASKIFSGIIDFVVDAFLGIIDFIQDNWLDLLLGALFGIPFLIIKALFALFPELTGFFLTIVDKFKGLGSGIVDFFKGIPDAIMDLFSNIGSNLKNALKAQLGFLRRLFPKSPVLEGPLMVLNDAGENAIDLIQEGIDRSPSLDFQAKVPGGDATDAQGLLPTPTAGGGGITVNITAEFNFEGSAPNDPSTSRIQAQDMRDAMDEWARTSLRAELGLT